MARPDRTSGLIEASGRLGKGFQIAVIGCGNWGRNLARCFSELGHLGAVADHHTALAKAVSAQCGSHALSFEQVLAEPSIEAVAIATQPATHYDLCKRSLEAGKHVFVEKPLALALNHAMELTELAGHLKRRLMVGHILHYHPAVTRLQSLIAAGAVGRVLRLHATRMNLGAIRREEDVLWCLGPHDISVILALVGTEPSEIHAHGGYYLGRTIADAATIHLTFPAGEHAEVNLSWLHPVKEHRLTIIGSEAMIVFDDGAPWARKLLMYPHFVDVTGPMPITIRAEPVPIALDEKEPLKLECQHFVDCIARGCDPITNGEEGLRVMRVLTQASLAMSRHYGSQAIRERSDGVSPAF